MINNNGSNGTKPDWIEIRDSRNRLLFKYNPERNEVEVKPKDSDIYTIVRLDEIRIKHGFTPEDMSLVFVREYVAVTRVLDGSTTPYSENKK